MADVNVVVNLNPLELKLLRRAIARAADEGQIDRTSALKRICELDALRWKEEERASKSAGRRTNKAAFLRSGRRKAA